MELFRMKLLKMKQFKMELFKMQEFKMELLKMDLFKIHLLYDITSESIITPCIKYNNPIVD